MVHNAFQSTVGIVGNESKARHLAAQWYSTDTYRGGQDSHQVHSKALQYPLVRGVILQLSQPDRVEDNQLDIVVALLHDQLNVTLNCGLDRRGRR